MICRPTRRRFFARRATSCPRGAEPIIRWPSCSTKSLHASTKPLQNRHYSQFLPTYSEIVESLEAPAISKETKKCLNNSWAYLQPSLWY
jgi:hypothetical protein